ncbi:hypothetical protein MMC30_008317 [Trapelia coarctata]|nr:hypothetical protein [Trapelia coarctata]
MPDLRARLLRQLIGKNTVRPQTDKRKSRGRPTNTVESEVDVASVRPNHQESNWSQAFEQLRQTKPDIAKKLETLVEEAADRVVLALQVAIKEVAAPLSNLDPVHIGLPLAGLLLNFSQQHEAAKVGFEKVMEIIARWLVIEANFNPEEDELDAKNSLSRNSLVTNKELAGRNKEKQQQFSIERRMAQRKALIGLYSKILEYQTIAASYFGRNTLERFGRAIPKLDDFVGLIKEITDLHLDCLQLFFLWELLSNTRFHAAKAQQEQDENLLRWISDYQYDADHDHAMRKLGSRYRKSGQWLLQHTAYQGWLNSIPSVFWLRGPVGTGKSSLMSIVVQDHLENLETAAKERLAYFYCSGKESPGPIYVLQSLVAQLAWNSDGNTIAEPLRDNYAAANKISGGGKLDIERCIELIITLTEGCTKVTLFIDALDECEDSWSVVSSFYKIIEASSGNIRVFLTSRMQVEVDKVIQSCAIVGPEENINDVRSYIKTEVTCHSRRLLEGKRPDLEDRLVNVLSLRAGDMFRWAELQLDTFFSSKSPLRNSKDVIHKLDLLEAELGTGHPSLNKVYGEIYEMNTPHSVDRMLATKALQWLFLPSLPPDEGGPQKQREDQSYLSQMITFVATNEDGSRDPDVPRGYVLSICSNFLRIKRTSEGQKIEFAHFSVMEYLRSRATLTNAKSEMPEYSSLMVHTQISATTMSYLLSDSLVKTVEHLQHAETYQRGNSVASEQRLGLSYASFVPDPLSLSFKMPEILRAAYLPRNVTQSAEYNHAFTFPEYAIAYWPLHYNAVFRCQAPEQLTHLLEKFLAVESGSRYFDWWLEGYIIHHAHQHQTVYRTDFFDSAARPSKNFTAIILGLEHIVKGFADAELRERNLSGNTCLEIAARYGQTSAVEKLLGRETVASSAEVCAFPGEDAGMPKAYSALHVACKNSHLEIVEMLLSRKAGIQADLHARDNNKRTPLLLATKHGTISVLDPLLHAGADADATDNDGATSLVLAVSALNSKAVEKLLWWKADPNIADSHKNTPLRRLWLNHFKETTEDNISIYREICCMLLEAGADIKCIDPDWVDEILGFDDAREEPKDKGHVPVNRNAEDTNSVELFSLD